MKLLPTLCAVGVCASASAQDPSGSSHDLFVFFGKGAKILGSSEIRDGGGIAYASARNEPRFRIDRGRAQLVYEGYVDYTDSDGAIRPNESSYAAGGIAYARWWLRPLASDPRFYVDLGEGLQIATRTTYDLPSEINSTPILDLGVAFRIGHEDGLFGVRFLHISNAGFVSPNRGQDEFFLTAGIQF